MSEQNIQQPTQIGLLIDELKSEDPKLRLHSIRQIKSIAQAIGIEKTREELIPFLSNISEDEEIEILITLAKELGDFEIYVGGTEYVTTLLPTLISLSSFEETSLRVQVISSIEKLTKNFSPLQFEKIVFPYFQKLAKKKWFTTRSSACGLLSILYSQLVETHKAQLRKFWSAFCRDSDVIVRKSASKVFKKMLPLLEPDLVKNFAIPLFIDLSNDSQDSIRILAASNSLSFSQNLNEIDIIHDIVPVIQTLSTDKSWRVRYTISEIICDFSKPIKPKVIETKILPLFLKLLRDTEPEVRTIICGKISDFCALLKQNLNFFKTILVPTLKELIHDNSEYVRVALADSITKLPPIVGKEITSENVVPLYLSLLREESAKIKLSIISNLNYVTEVLGIELIISLLIPSIIGLVKDNNWRIRLSIISYIPTLAPQLDIGYFNENFLEFSLNLLLDYVFTIREAACKNIQDFTRIFGFEWSIKFIFPSLVELSKNENYLFRQTAISCFGLLIPEYGCEHSKQTIWPELFRMASDPIPNIRLFLVTNLEKLLEYMDKEVFLETKEKLLLLVEDNDSDVIFFAKQLYNKIESKF
ncbi:protein phosphatase 2 (formerly 2a) regulatory subunit a beta isoform-related [Anaeramoeba flamelloides]|uniref:Protein phosphatase 2 (Formerly 2a) regulatory subunit a beta isoform-related n=1 Tax=Anaeramoeba flamelloides TaxID=1746091 RepID=A0AAV7YRM0_9EUKA|nr:protein phosphatase 2 (formerly 2a) regulatory subunit a beta isoform-related [Anaeramoeba flamelloides]